MNKHKKKLNKKCVYLVELIPGTKMYVCDAYHRDFHYFLHMYPQCKNCDKRLERNVTHV